MQVEGRSCGIPGWNRVSSSHMSWEKCQQPAVIASNLLFAMWTGVRHDDGPGDVPLEIPDREHRPGLLEVCSVMNKERIWTSSPWFMTARTWQEKLREAQLLIKVDELLSFNLVIIWARGARHIS